MTVYCVINNDKEIICIQDEKKDADAIATEYNANPFIDEETPDTGAPYHVESWVVQQGRQG